MVSWPRIGTPSSYGWVRRSDKDTQLSQCWEQPDGRFRDILKSIRFCLVQHAPDQSPQIKVMTAKADRAK